MTVNVKVYGKIFVVPSGTVKEAVDNLLDGTMDGIEAKPM